MPLCENNLAVHNLANVPRHNRHVCCARWRTAWAGSKHVGVHVQSGCSWKGASASHGVTASEPCLSSGLITLRARPHRDGCTAAGPSSVTFGLPVSNPWGTVWCRFGEKMWGVQHESVTPLHVEWGGDKVRAVGVLQKYPNFSSEGVPTLPALSECRPVFAFTFMFYRLFSTNATRGARQQTVNQTRTSAEGVFIAAAVADFLIPPWNFLYVCFLMHLE